jgi:hypothetical protein
MSRLGSDNPNATRRLNRAISRDRLRNVLIIVGIVLAIGGILMAVYPFGPAISNPVAIPKADPLAGLWLLQALPAETALRTGLAISAVGVVMLVLVMLLGTRKARHGADRQF